MAAKKTAQHKDPKKQRGYDITKFSRARPDAAMEALEETMPPGEFLSFNEIFDKAGPVYRTKSSSSGEEMARLRLYEKLQNMVTGGKVEKMGKTYALKAKPAATE